MHDVAISLCMIVHNEQANLPVCLSSAADLVDELIVVDTGSTDRTKEVAAAFGARVVDFAWVDSFAAARNESLRHAAGRWIFSLDADDRIDEDNRGKLRTLFAGLGSEIAAYSLKYVSLPDQVTRVGTVNDRHLLFRNHPQVRWERRVHEQIHPSVRRLGGAVRKAEVCVHHTGYQDPALRQRKTERNLRLLHLEDAEHPDDPLTLLYLGEEYSARGRFREALPLLQRSLERSRPGRFASWVYAALARVYRGLGQRSEALALCRAGRQHDPDDPSLLLQEEALLEETGDVEGAIACLTHLLGHWPEPHFPPNGPRRRLAELVHRQGREGER